MAGYVKLKYSWHLLKKSEADYLRGKEQGGISRWKITKKKRQK